MFVKLLKQEWRAIREVLGLLCLIILLCGVVIGGVTNYMVTANAPDSVTVTCILLFTAGVIGVAVCFAGSVFLVLWRYYQSRFTDEGYLTFTLPVTEHSILFSSIAVSFIAIVLTALAALASVGIAFFGYFLAFREDVAWQEVVQAIQVWWPQIRDSFREVAPELGKFTMMMLSGAISQFLLLMLAVTIGAVLARKHKILAAFAAYFGIGFVRSALFIGSAVHVDTESAMLGLFGTETLLNLLLVLAAYGGMYWLTSRKLNLN